MKKDFKSDFPIERRLIRGGLASALVIVILSAWVNYLPFIGGRWFVLVGFFSMLIGLVGVGSYLWIRYFNQPEVHEKARTGPALLEHEEKISKAKAQISSLENARARLDNQEQTQLSARNGQFQVLLNEINEKRNLAENEYRQTHQISLRQLQLAHLRNGLMNEKLSQANIPAVTPELIQALADRHIVTAHDLRPEWLEQFALEAEQRAGLINWRNELEAQYRITQPDELSQPEVAQINEEYEAKITKLDRDEIIAKAALEKDFLEIREQASKFREANRDRLLAARSALRGLDEKKVALQTEHDSYTRITFTRYFSLALRHALGFGLPYALEGGMVYGYLFILLLIQGYLSIQATQIIVVDLIPTEEIQPIENEADHIQTDNRACLPANTLQQTGIVSRIVDGDTIDVSIGVEIIRVRYIGVDAPEPEQDFGGLALFRNRELAAGEKVTLISDTSDTDPFDRYLRYVLVGDIFVNYQLVLEGYARASAFPPDTACQVVFENAEKEAQENKLGIWASVTPPPTISLPEEVMPADDVCGCQTNSLDCSDFSTQVEAQACFSYCFSLGAGDIHRLDGNADGRACESLP